MIRRIALDFSCLDVLCSRWRTPSPPQPLHLTGRLSTGTDEVSEPIYLVFEEKN